MRWLTGVVLLALGCGGRTTSLLEGESGGVGGTAGYGGSTSTGTSSHGGVTTAGTAAVVGGASVGATSGVLEAEVTSDDLLVLSQTTCNVSTIEPLGASGIAISLVVDASDSMNTPVDSSNTETRWTATKAELLDAISGSSSGFPTPSSVELRLFPASAADSTAAQACVGSSAEVALGDWETQIELYRSALDGRVPAGKSSLRDAIYAAKTSLVASGIVEGLGNPHIILVTDGMASLDEGCTEPSSSDVVSARWATDSTLDNVIADTNAVVTEIIDARSRGIRTVVVGTEGSGATNWLSSAAIAGGTAKSECVDGATSPCHIDLAGGDTLASELGALWDSGASIEQQCVLKLPVLPGVPWSLATTTVIGVREDGSGRLYQPNDTATVACDQGFQFDGVGTLRLCDSACSAWKNREFVELQVYQGCDTSCIACLQ